MVNSMNGLPPLRGDNGEYSVCRCFARSARFADKLNISPQHRRFAPVFLPSAINMELSVSGKPHLSGGFGCG